METKNGPEQGHADTILQRHVDALDGLQAARPTGAGPEPGSASGQRPMTVASLADSLAAQQQRLDELERSLVERIADVDDDRRRTAVLLQRARQGQEEEVTARLRRQARMVLWAIAALAALVAVALAALAWHTEASRQALSVEIAAVERAAADRAVPASQAERPAGDEELARRIAVLGATVADVSAALARIDERTADERASVAATLERLDAERQRLAAEVAALREAHATGIGSAYAQRPPAEAEAKPASPPSAPTEEPAGTSSPADEAAETGTDDASAAAAAPATREEELSAPISEPTIEPAPQPSKVLLGDRPYALQLVGYFERDRLLAFVAHADLPDPVYYRAETYQGRPWYALIHSLYPSYAEAMAARAALAPELLALAPLVRKLPEGSELGVLER